MRAENIIGGSPASKRKPADFYPTPDEVTQALLDFWAIPRESLVWEPACGDGHMVKTLKRNGFKVIGTDIRYGVDFLSAELPANVDYIITNPPFILAEEFIRKCAEHKKDFALLLKSQYWHSQKRFQLFNEITPRYILPLTWRPDFLFGEGGGKPLMDVVWCVWAEENGRYSGIPGYFPLQRNGAK